MSSPFGFGMGPTIVSGLAMFIILFFIVSGLLMWLWNITITRIFTIREITFWEAFRLLIIATILFGNGGLNF